MSAPGISESLTIEPPPAVWVRALSRCTPATADQRRIREQLGLGTIDPIVMSGHQAEFWHPGILAKYFAMMAAAELVPDARAAWVVVDQDTNDPATIRYPKRAASAGLVRGTWHVPIGSAGGPLPEVPTAHLAPLSPPRDLDLLVRELQPATEGVAGGIRRIAFLLHDEAKGTSAAEQVGAAVWAALRDITAPAPAHSPLLLFATRLNTTDLFAAWVQRMREDPGTCASAYNGAVAAHPHARIRPLEVAAGRCELPLWRVQAGHARRRIFAEGLADIPREQLAPRALLMTALLRAGACDLFIHGLGGAVYDQVTEHWMAAWQPGVALAPTAVATATRLLRFSGDPAPSPQTIARAAWLAHSARHDPAVLGDTTAAEEKRLLVLNIARAREAGHHPRPLYLELHHLLESVRRRHSAALRTLDDEAAALRARRAEAGVAFDRAWPFPLYDAAQLKQLRDEVIGVFLSGRTGE